MNLSRNKKKILKKRPTYIKYLKDVHTHFYIYNLHSTLEYWCSEVVHYSTFCEIVIGMIFSKKVAARLFFTLHYNRIEPIEIVENRFRFHLAPIQMISQFKDI